MTDLYKGQAGSPITYLSSDISANQTTISIADDSALPDAPNICTIGYGENLETIKYETKSNGVLQNVTRGVEGTPRAWQKGTEVARFFTAYDHNSIIESFNSHLAEKATRNDLGHIRLEEFFMAGTLQNGWTGSLQYAKNDLGLVTVKADVTIGTIAADTIICTLPEGYRANRRSPIPVQITNTSSGSLGLYLNDLGGHIRVSGGSGLSQGLNIRFMIIYNIN